MNLNYEKINLISTAYSKDEYGVDRATETKNEIFAKVGSISGREFFNAGVNDIKPELKLIVNSYEYNGEKIIEYGATKYTVYRTYQASENSLELYVQRKVGDNGTSTA